MKVPIRDNNYLGDKLFTVNVYDSLSLSRDGM